LAEEKEGKSDKPGAMWGETGWFRVARRDPPFMKEKEEESINAAGWA